MLSLFLAGPLFLIAFGIAQARARARSPPGSPTSSPMGAPSSPGANGQQGFRAHATRAYALTT
jgi:hypothetical protein